MKREPSGTTTGKALWQGSGIGEGFGGVTTPRAAMTGNLTCQRSFRSVHHQVTVWFAETECFPSSLPSWPSPFLCPVAQADETANVDATTAARNAIRILCILVLLGRWSCRQPFREEGASGLLHRRTS